MKATIFELVCVFLYLTRLRDRLRCPRCEAVGTYKPHGSFIDRFNGDTRAVRRWLCKYCGYYRGPEGECTAHPSTKGYWILEDDGTIMTVPRRALELQYPTLKAPWPWRG